MEAVACETRVRTSGRVAKTRGCWADRHAILLFAMNDLTTACDRLDAAIAADTLTRRRWTAEEHGRHLSCLLAAMVPECGESETATTCPATVIPSWLAHLTSWIDDAGSQDRWPWVVREYARLLRASAELTPEQWRRLDFACRAIAVREARGARVLAAIDGVLGLLDRAAAGGTVSDHEWTTSRAVAEASAETAETALSVASSVAASVASSVAVADYMWMGMAVVWAAPEATSETAEAAADHMAEGIFAAWLAVTEETPCYGLTESSGSRLAHPAR